MKKSAIVFLLFSFLLTSCGAKKNVATGDQEPAANTLEQRIAAGEFAWLDTIQIDTTSIDRRLLQPSYNFIDIKEKSANGSFNKNPTYTIDSLIFLGSGYYKMYKSSALVDYGRYSAIGADSIPICQDGKSFYWPNDRGWYSVLTLYSCNNRLEQYIACFGYEMGLYLTISYMSCEDSALSSNTSLGNTRWKTSNRINLENLERNLKMFDSIYQNTPIFTGFEE